MKSRDRSLFFCGLVSVLGLVSTHPNPSLAQTSGANCPTPALERFLRHQVARGETLDSIAQRYNIMPTTIINMNPGLKNRRVAVGSEIIIPPYDGIVVEVARGQTWKQLAAKYNVRSDVLFELNGCQPPSQIAFIPAGKKAPNRASAPTSSTQNGNSQNITGYPLPQVAQVGFPYGWQINPKNGEVFFHSGIDLLAPTGTSVNAIAPGTVVFAGQQGSYGNLVIINHDNEQQSRYGHLENIKVKVGQQVKQGDSLGTVGTTGQPTINQPHLHFEIRASSSLGWAAKDPREHLQK